MNTSAKILLFDMSQRDLCDSDYKKMIGEIFEREDDDQPIQEAINLKYVEYISGILKDKVKRQNEISEEEKNLEKIQDAEYDSYRRCFYKGNYQNYNQDSLLDVSNDKLVVSLDEMLGMIPDNEEMEVEVKDGEQKKMKKIKKKEEIKDHIWGNLYNKCLMNIEIGPTFFFNKSD